MKQLKITKFPELDYAGSEAFNTLSTNLSFAGETVKKIMITSCHASEGKSYLSMNLMRTLAQRGMKVALVDADLRRSMVNAQYGLQFENGRNDDKGLSHFLAGMVGMEEVIYQTDIPGAMMVPVGRDVPNPLDLLSNHHFKDLLDTLAQMVDYVLVDAAPVGVVIDAAEIAKSCDGTLIAVQYNDVRRQELLDVKQQIEQSGCPILGTVLNQVDYDSYLSRKYYYRPTANMATTTGTISTSTRLKRNERLYGLSRAFRLWCGRRCPHAGRDVCHAGCGGGGWGHPSVCHLSQHAGHGTLSAGRVSAAS